MNAKFVADCLGMNTEYNLAVSEIGEEHKCNQGCSEGSCSRNEDRHQYNIIEKMGEINAKALKDGAQ